MRFSSPNAVAVAAQPAAADRLAVEPRHDEGARRRDEVVGGQVVGVGVGLAVPVLDLGRQRRRERRRRRRVEAVVSDPDVHPRSVRHCSSVGSRNT
jgi:hypothetical protein